MRANGNPLTVENRLEFKDKYVYKNKRVQKLHPIFCLK